MRNFLGGFTVAVLNGGLLATTVGISGAALAASMVLGTIVAGDGYTRIMMSAAGMREA
jgi:hypothetical protein